MLDASCVSHKQGWASHHMQYPQDLIVQKIIIRAESLSSGSNGRNSVSLLRMFFQPWSGLRLTILCIQLVAIALTVDLLQSRDSCSCMIMLSETYATDTHEDNAGDPARPLR